MPVIRAATVLTTLSDGIKARFECKTGITVPCFDKIKHISSKEGLFETGKSCYGQGRREKEMRRWHDFFAFELTTQNYSYTKQIFGNMGMIFIL